MSGEKPLARQILFFFFFVLYHGGRNKESLSDLYYKNTNILIDLIP